MGFLTPREPGAGLVGWRSLSLPRALDATAGTDTARPDGPVPALVRLAAFAVGAVLIVAATPATGGLADPQSWWTSPIAFEKVLVWALLWELAGLGAGPLRLTGRRAVPPVGGGLYFLRAGTIRLPSRPDTFASTSGTRRGRVDVVLFVAVLASGVALLGSGGHELPRPVVCALIVCLAALGLRDRTALLAARPELYGPLLLVVLFPGPATTFAFKLCMVAMWWGAATSRLGLTTVADLRTVARMRSAVGTHAVTVLVYLAPAVLLVSRGGWLTTAAVVVLVGFHLMLAATAAPGVSLEWNAFAVFATLVLFGHHAGVGVPSLAYWPLLLALIVLLAVPLIAGAAGSATPWLPSLRLCRCAAARRATSAWLFRADGAERRFDEALVRPDPVAVRRLADLAVVLPAAPAQERPAEQLLARAVADPAAYCVRDGELVAAAALGRSLGDGHLHDERLLAAVQERCGFQAGQLRLITLDAQPLLRRTRNYRVLDAAGGLLEAGTVRAADLVAGQVPVPVPVDVTFELLPPVRKRIIPAPSRPRPVPANGRPRPRPGLPAERP